MFFSDPPRGKTMHLRPINCTPLERGDQIHNKKFQPHIIEPTVQSKSYATFWLRNSTIWQRTFWVILAVSKQIQCIEIALYGQEGKLFGFTSFSCTILLRLYRSQFQSLQFRVGRVGKVFQNHNFSCGTGCQMIFRGHSI